MIHANITKGITLLETMVVIALSSLILFALLSLYIEYGVLFNYNETEFNTVNDNRQAFRSISTNVLQGHRVMASHVFSTGTYTTGSSTLVLQLPAINASGAVLNNTWDYVVFYQTGEDLYRRQEADAASARVTGTKLLGSSILAITFTLDNATHDLVKNVTVDITAREKKGHLTTTNRNTNQIHLRNY